MEFYYKFVDRFHDISKVKNPAVSKEKEKVLGEYAVTLAMLYSKVLMIWFHKILKLIFQMQPSSPRNICTEDCRKLPNLTGFLDIFLYIP